MAALVSPPVKVTGASKRTVPVLNVSPSKVAGCAKMSVPGPVFVILPLRFAEEFSVTSNVQSTAKLPLSALAIVRAAPSGRSVPPLPVSIPVPSAASLPIKIVPSLSVVPPA